MKIALIYLGRRGGGAAFSFEMARGLMVHVQVGAFLSQRVENRSRWDQLPIERQFFPIFDHFEQAVFETLSRQRLNILVRSIRAWSPDVLLFPMFHPWNGLLQKALADLPSIVVVHDPLAHPGFIAWLHRVVENVSLRRATMALVLSQTLAPALSQRGVPAERISVIPHGGLNFQAQGTRSDPNGAILFFGRITAYKGLEYLLRAFRKVRQRHPEIRLSIVGEGDLRPYRQELADLEGVEVINRWVSEPEISTCFQTARMVVLPYTSATQSGVIPIAAGFGLPVIATCVGGLMEQIEDQRTGLLVPPADETALADAIERLITHPHLGEELGTALQAEFQENRNWQTIGAQIERVCQKAIEFQRMEKKA